MLGQKHTPAQAVPDDPDPTLSVREAAALLGWPEERVRLALRSDTLRGVQPGGKHGSHWAVYRWSVDALLAREAPGLIPAELADKMARFVRWSINLAALGQEIEDDVRQLTPYRDGVAR
jgi:hypothetical protein